MDKLLKLLPNAGLGKTFTIFTFLFAVGTKVDEIPGMDPNVRGVAWLLVLIAALGVFAVAGKSNPDGTDSEKPYLKK